MALFNRLVILFLPLIPKPIVRMIAKRYVAGSELKDAIATVKKLNSQGMVATLDVLGESAVRHDESRAAVEEYCRVLEAIDHEKLNCNISVKPTQLGLLIDKEFCYENVRRIAEKAASYGNFVRIDMEDANCTTATIDLFLRLYKDFNNIGIVIQAYLRRSIEDVKRLVQVKTNFRLCKGIYIEPRRIAYKDPQIVNENFCFLLETMLKAHSYVGIATHDEKLVWQGMRLIETNGLRLDQYEFQMLLGVDEELRKIIVDAGHKLRVYVPYGKQWYPYCKRRLKENPMIAFYVLKAMFGLR
jgi:proline dehydrogenase